jgi:drug/metabolite transporter (DMT)-like permease
MKRNHSPRAALLALAATILIWGTVPLILRHIARAGVLDAWTVNGVRYAFTALFWLPYLIAHRRELAAQPGIWRDASLPAGIHFFGQTGWGLAPYFATASVMNFASRSSFLFAILLGFWLLPDERRLVRHPLFWVGTGATILGLAGLFGPDLAAGGTGATGFLLLTATALCWAGYGVQVRKRMQRHPSPLACGAVSLWVGPPLIALMFAVGDWRALAQLGAWDWLMLAFSGCVAIALGHLLFYQGLRAFGPVATEGSMSLIPFLTALLSGIVIQEHLGALQWCGGLLLVLGSLALLAAKARELRREPVTDDVAPG